MAFDLRSTFCVGCFLAGLSKTFLLYGFLYVCGLTYKLLPGEILKATEENGTEITVVVSLLSVGIAYIGFFLAGKVSFRCCILCFIKSIFSKLILVSLSLYALKLISRVSCEQLIDQATINDKLQQYPFVVLAATAFIPSAAFYLGAGIAEWNGYSSCSSTRKCPTAEYTHETCDTSRRKRHQVDLDLNIPKEPAVNTTVSMKPATSQVEEKTFNVKEIIESLNADRLMSKESRAPIETCSRTPIRERRLPFLGELQGRIKSSV